MLKTPEQKYSPPNNLEPDNYHVSDFDVEQSIGHDSKNWTYEMSHYLAILSYKCVQNFWIHDQDANHFHKLDKKMTSYSSLASVVSSLTITAVMGLFEDNEVVFFILTGTTIVLNLIVTLINTWAYIYDYTSRVLAHSDKAAKYHKLHRKITSQFVLPLSERYSAKTLMEYVNERMGELEREQPFNRSTTAKRWSTKRVDFFDELFTLPRELHEDEDRQCRLVSTDVKSS